MAEADFDSGNDSLSPTLSIRLHGSKVGGRFAPDPKLLFTSAKALHRVGGDLRRPHETLLRWDDMEVTPLGAGLIVYSALTIAVLPDERFFQTGRLLEFGEALADEAGIQPWTQFVRDRAPDLAGEVGLRVAFTTFEPGSFRFRLRLVPTLQGIAAAVTIMNQGPGAIEMFEDIVLPKAEIALKLGYSYAERYAECLEKYLVIDIVEVPPDPRPFIKPPPIAHRGRRRAD